VNRPAFTGSLLRKANLTSGGSPNGHNRILASSLGVLVAKCFVTNNSNYMIGVGIGELRFFLQQVLKKENSYIDFPPFGGYCNTFIEAIVKVYLKVQKRFWQRVLQGRSHLCKFTSFVFTAWEVFFEIKNIY